MKQILNVLYVHGYAGSGSGETASTIKRLLNPDKYNMISPNFSNRIADIEKNIGQVNEIIEEHHPAIIIGNSLGTFEVMNAKSGAYKILINPVFNPTTDSLQPEMFDDSFMDISDRISELADSQKFDNKDKGKTYGFFGELDDVVSCQPQFEKMFGAKYMTVFRGVGHKFFEAELRVVVELIEGLV